jgi:hypothetical protein
VHTLLEPNHPVHSASFNALSTKHSSTLYQKQKGRPAALADSHHCSSNFGWSNTMRKVDMHPDENTRLHAGSDMRAVHGHTAQTKTPAVTPQQQQCLTTTVSHGTLRLCSTRQRFSAALTCGLWLLVITVRINFLGTASLLSLCISGTAS